MDKYGKFSELPEEKQLKIINAGLELFGKCGYKNANTEDIAHKAGISKGLLFYYFKNKEKFYLYLCEFCEGLMQKAIDEKEFSGITDFFQLLEYGAKVKADIVIQYPFITDFCSECFLSACDRVENASNRYVSERMAAGFDTYFQKIDFTPFKETVDPKKIYQMLIWLSEGYLLEKRRMNLPVSFEDMLREFDQWKEMLRKISYKENYL